MIVTSRIIIRNAGIIELPIWGDQTMQMYGKFEGAPLNSALLGLVI